MKFLKSLPKDKLQKLILTVIVALIAIGAVINFYVMPQVTKLSVHRAEVRKLQDQITEVQEAVKNEVLYTARRDQMRAFLNAQESRMVDADSFSWVVREISLFAEKHPVQVRGLSSGTSAPYTKNTKYEVYSTHFDVDGTYDQLGRFIRDWENSFPTSWIRSMTVAIADVSKGQLRATLEVSLLMQPKASREKPVDSKATPEKGKPA